MPRRVPGNGCALCVDKAHHESARNPFFIQSPRLRTAIPVTISEDLEPPVVAVTHPNGGESYGPGDTVDIEWVASDNACVETIDIYYSVNGGADYTELATGEEDDSLYEWVVPLELGDSCVVKVVAWDPSSHAAEDESDGPFYVTNVSTDAVGTPHFANRLEQNYPNPFNGTTTITYSIEARSEVDIRIYDTAGRLVSVLERATREPGRYSTIWRGTDREGRAVTSGVYFCSIRAGGFEETRKIIYLR